MTLVLPLTDPLATQVAHAGGKGASLAKSAQSLPVPPGLVVDSSAYREFIAPLRPAIEAILDETRDADARSQRIQALILAHPLPNELGEELIGVAQDLGLFDHNVAVRSSGTMEDLPGAAFAGQHDTFLGVRGPIGIFDAVRRCYASLWNAHVLPYREKMGLNHLDAAMAVFVQRMVEVRATDAAGVAFSVDPVRGELHQVLINAAFGLGETVVGGEAPVDEYRLDRTTQAEGDVTIAEKGDAIVTDGRGGTEHVVLPEDQRNAPSLTPEQRVAVAQLALAAEAHFGFPQDIEWAFQGAELFLLQSRPVTRIPARWTRDESAERFPNAVTPLTWDLCEAGFHASLNHSFKLMGLPPFGDKWFTMKDYHIYGNQNAVKLYSGRTPVKMLQSVESVRAALPQIAQQFAWVQELPTQWMRDLDTYLLAIGGLMAEDLAFKTTRQLWDYVLRINELGARYFLPNIAISLTQRTLYVGLLQMLKLALPAEQAQAVFDQLMAVADTKTGQVNAELWELSRQVRRDPVLREMAATLDGHAFLACLKDVPLGVDQFAFSVSFQEFLRRHGHRELDFDAYQPTWVEAPHTVIDQIRLLADRPDEDRAGAERAQKIAQANMEHRVLAEAPEELRYLVHEVIRLARAYTALDDLEHYQTTRLTLPFRRGLNALGRHLVLKGALTENMDIFFVPFADLDRAIRTDDFSAIPELVARHKAGYAAAHARSPEWVHGEADDLSEAGEGDLQGLGGSPGVVEGEVFLVHGPEDFSKFPKDAILVARTTNPAWTPLFYQARGVITESGGPLSHGAVTARELGLPAVMSVRHALRLFENGERVRVDGARGRVQRLSPTSAADEAAGSAKFGEPVTLPGVSADRLEQLKANARTPRPGHAYPGPTASDRDF